MKKALVTRLLFFSLCSILTLGNSPLVKAQLVTGSLKQVRFVEIEHVFGEEYFGRNSAELLGAGGVPFPPGAHTLLKLNDPAAGDASLVLVAPPANTNGRITRTPLKINDPINIAFDTLSRGASGFGQSRLFQLDTGPVRLNAIKGGAQDELVPQGIEHSNLSRLRITNPQGMTLQPSNGVLYILDADGPSIIRLTPRVGRDFAEAPVSSVALSRSLGVLRGLAFNPEDNHVYVMNPEQHLLYKLTLAGEVVTAFDFPIDGVLQGMIFAPSLDLTDYPGVHHLFLATEDGARSHVSEWVIPGSLSPRANFPEEQ